MRAALLALLPAARRAAGWGALDRVLLPDAVATHGAMCIDGTPGGYYWRAGADSTGLVLAMQGGGWCNSPSDCHSRSKNFLGSSKDWPATWPDFGISSADPAKNPSFHQFNIAFAGYCDGAYFATDREAPLAVGGDDLHFRGRRNLDAILDDLFARRGAAAARRVVVYGESAGGIACYMHCDYVARRFAAQNATTKCVCDSGWAMEVASNPPPFEGTGKSREWADTLNLTHAMNERCVAAQPDGAQYRCVVPEVGFPHITSPVFVLNSQPDCAVMSLDGGAAVRCLPVADPADGRKKCSDAEMPQFNAIVDKVRASWRRAGALGDGTAAPRPGNGMFSPACVDHTLGWYGNYWNNPNYQIRNRTAAEAVGDWFFGTGDAAHVSYDDCYAGDGGCNDNCLANFSSCLGDPNFPPPNKP